MTERTTATGFIDIASQDVTVFAPEQESQIVVMLATQPNLASALGALCGALDIDLIRVASHHDLPYTLHRHHPIAVVSVMDGASQAACNALRSVAAHDPDLPVLLVTDDDPASLGTIDAAEQLWGLTGIHRIPESPGPHDLIGFLFQAGRRCGTGRLIPMS